MTECGISGYYNGKGAIKKAFQILLNQQSRGSDATGIAYLSNTKIHIIKKAVPPEKFKETIDNINDEDIYVAIGHNRHATSNTLEKHLDSEAHPFISEDKSFAIVHNGTVRNERVIRKLLQIKDNHAFSSKVDSEVYVHILEDILKIEPSRIKAIEKLHAISEGNILILFSDGELIGISSNAFVIAKQGDTVLIASEKGSILPLLTNKFQIAIPKTGDKPRAVRVKLKEDDRPDVVFYGEWEVEKLEFPEGFKPARKVQCDFCKELNKWCEKYPYSKEVFKDRCVECFKKKVTKLPEVPVVESPVVYTPSKRSASKPLKKTFITCAGYKHEVADYKALYCCYCGMFYCKGCFRDARRHVCVTTSPALKGHRTIIPRDDGWDLFA